MEIENKTNPIVEGETKTTKTFTQEEVNSIVKLRLDREKQNGVDKDRLAQLEKDSAELLILKAKETQNKLSSELKELGVNEEILELAIKLYDVNDKEKSLADLEKAGFLNNTTSKKLNSLPQGQKEEVKEIEELDPNIDYTIGS